VALVERHHDGSVPDSQSISSLPTSGPALATSWSSSWSRWDRS
jgi:hypothetical protein